MNAKHAWAALLGLIVGIIVSASTACAAETVTLRVALYPYVPGAQALFATLAREFERRNDGVVLQPVEIDPHKDYYDDGLLTLDADVFEIDTILLSDMIAAGKIAPLALSREGFAPESIDAVMRDGIAYAVPHWLCGNFLFYRKGDAAIRDAVTWVELLAALAQRQRPLLVDLFSSLTLGEWYLTMLADRRGIAAAQDTVLAGGEPDAAVIADLKSILTACPADACRSRERHAQTGSVARAFMRGEGDAYIGYSETLHFALSDNDCPRGLWCLDPNAIAVRRLPTLTQERTAAGVGWVDGLALSSALTGAKKELALKFIAFATSPEGYRAVLEPQGGEAPRYLLPARPGPTFNGAPLYPELLAAHAGRQSGTRRGLNAALRTLGGKLNCLLPIDPADTQTLASCAAR